MPSREAALAYTPQRPDRVREELEQPFFARLVPALVRASPGGALLDLGCADGLMATLAGPRLDRYLGIDLRPRAHPDLEVVSHDLRSGLGYVGPAPFDLYLGTFGVASHVAPGELRRLLRQIARHARPGALVALEGLGLQSLEWPRLWSTAPGPARTIAYRLAADVRVHPWSARELCALYEDAGIRPLRALDRSLQAGPKAGEPGYWPGMPALRGALDALLGGRDIDWARRQLGSPLPPLPAGSAALVHQTLAARRASLVRERRRHPRGLARAVWEIEPPTGGGYGHGVTVVGAVR